MCTLFVCSNAENTPETMLRNIVAERCAIKVAQQLRLHETNCCATKIADSTDEEAAAVITLLRRAGASKSTGDPNQFGRIHRLCACN